MQHGTTKNQQLSYRWVALCVAILGSVLAGGPSAAVAQSFGGYPTTQFRGFDNSGFAITPPTTADPPGFSGNDHTAMSPESWGTPATIPLTNPVTAGAGGSLSPSKGAASSLDSLSNTGVRPLGQSVLAGTAMPSIPNLKRDTASGTSRSGTAGPFRNSSFAKPQSNQTDQLGAGELAGQIQPGQIQPGQIQPAGRYPLWENESPQANTFDNSVRPPPPSTTGFVPAPSMPATSNGFSQSTSPVPTMPQQMLPEQSLTGRAPSNGFTPMAPNGFGNYGPPPVAFRPDLGHREPHPTLRNPGTYDSGRQTYDFEDSVKKKQYPPLSEILATGRYFVSANTRFLRPSFQNNTAITTLGSGFGESQPFDFDYEAAPQFKFGFESKYGPGIEFDYTQYDETSNVARFTSNGSITGTVSTWMLGPSRWSRLEAVNAGEALEATHTIDIESLGVSFFKEIKFPISRLNGMFGFQYVSIAQNLDATLRNAGGEIGRLNSRSDMRAFGPRFQFEYYRPIGHTKFEFITSFAGGTLFGRRDQFVQNTLANDFSRVGADEFITNFRFFSGGQFKKMVAENRGFFARAGISYEAWLGGGTAVNAQDDFGLRGFSFAVGYNR